MSTFQEEEKAFWHTGALGCSGGRASKGVLVAEANNTSDCGMIEFVGEDGDRKTILEFDLYDDLKALRKLLEDMSDRSYGN